VIRRAMMIALVALAACGTNGADRYDGDAPDPVALYGDCAFCHGGVADRLIATGGHGDPNFRCQVCHDENLIPGDVGPGHRNVPVCADCHQTQLTHHDPQAGTADECRVCHSTHGSTNLALVRTRITVPSGERRDVDFTQIAGLADGGGASLSDPGSGVCETCHTMTRHYRGDGSGSPHFTQTCFPCHQHADSFAPN